LETKGEWQQFSAFSVTRKLWRGGLLPEKKTIRIQIESRSVWVIRWRQAELRCPQCGAEVGPVEAARDLIPVAPGAAQQWLRGQKFWWWEAPGWALQLCLRFLRERLRRN
jgi:hypothetical protein